MSVLARKWLRLDGKDFSFDRYPMQVAFYDGRFPRMLFKTSRQVGKSVTLAGLNILECCVTPHFSTMFVSPSKEQTTRFSSSRLTKIMKYSPKIRDNFLQTDLTDRVFHKQFTNGSEMLLTYACDDAERLRGPTTHRNMYDEVQDMLYDPVIIIGNETMSNSDFQFETYAGTPLTMENTIQYLWETSTQNEWIMKCEACGSRQYIDSDKALGKHGPICIKPGCGAYLNPFEGGWVALNPPREENNENFYVKLHGFHLNQLILPSNVPKAMEKFGQEAAELAQRRWDRILAKHNAPGYSEARFNNEVIGVSDAVGTRLLTQEELERCCDERWPLVPEPNQNVFRQFSAIVAGVDWSGGGTTGISRTVLWICGWEIAEQRYRLLYYKVYTGRNPVDIVDDIAAHCLRYRVQMVVGDAGEGHLANNLLAKKIGARRVYQLQYGSQKKALTWNGVDRFTGDRTILIDNYFMLLKRGGVAFGPKKQMSVAFDDILNEYEEITLQGKKVWRHSPQKPDDCLHAGLFSWVAHRIVSGDLQFTG